MYLYISSVCCMKLNNHRNNLTIGTKLQNLFYGIFVFYMTSNNWWIHDNFLLSEIFQNFIFRNHIIQHMKYELEMSIDFFGIINNKNCFIEFIKIDIVLFSNTHICMLNCVQKVLMATGRFMMS